MTGRNGCGLAASMTSWGLLGSLGTYQDLAGWLGAFWHLLGSPGNFETLGPHGLCGGARLRLGRAVRRFTSWIAPSLRLTWSALANLKRAWSQSSQTWEHEFNLRPKLVAPMHQAFFFWCTFRLMWPYQFLPFGALQVTSGTILRLQLQALSFFAGGHWTAPDAHCCSWTRVGPNGMEPATSLCETFSGFCQAPPNPSREKSNSAEHHRHGACDVTTAGQIDADSFSLLRILFVTSPRHGDVWRACGLHNCSVISCLHGDVQTMAAGQIQKNRRAGHSALPWSCQHVTRMKSMQWKVGRMVIYTLKQMAEERISSLTSQGSLWL